MFEIILLEKVRGLGDLGETVRVANGYARNFLIPRKKAVIATPEAKSQVEERRRQLAQEEGKRVEVAQARADLAAREITLTRLARDTGDLYGSVSPADIAEALEAAGARIEKSEILQPDGPIKRTGQFEAEVILHPEVRFTVQIHVQGGGSNAPTALADGEAVDGAADGTDAAEKAGAAADSGEAAGGNGATAADATGDDSQADGVPGADSGTDADDSTAAPTPAKAGQADAGGA
ncbi:MAG: 50S ribosomal protein L9 [Gammaproteobacteria bacterium]|nr:50S ribosomal protein L9 [Gammaproteobacteria bacterium]